MTDDQPRQGRAEAIDHQADSGPVADGTGPESSNGTSNGAMEAQVLALRDTGRSFAAIARQLGITRAVDAQAAFVRAVKNQPESDRRDLVQRESGRLDDLEKRIRDDDTQDPERAQRRLVALEKLRRAIS